MVGAHAPLDRARRDVGLEFLVEFEMVFLGEDVDLGAGQLLPFGDAGIERLVFLTANQFRIDRDAGERAGKPGRRRRARGDDERQERHGHQGCAFHDFLLFRFAGAAGTVLEPRANAYLVHI